MKTIDCKRIKKSYSNGESQTPALKGIDLEISDRELTLLVGPSGSGKTTLLAILETILTPDEGDLFILDHHINKMSELEKAHFRNAHIGVVFQAFFLIPTLTVLENIMIPSIIKGENQRTANKRGLAILHQLKLDNKGNSLPSQLSRGQQQRVAIARALINDPKILLCDEPTASLDQENGHSVMMILRDLAARESRTVFVITHDHRIFSFADRIININDGLIGDKNE